MAFIKVDLPAPFGPTTVTTSPARTRIETPLNMSSSALYPATRSWVSSTIGTAFDVAVVGSMAVAFPVAQGTVGQSTFALPGSVSTFVVTGLTPSGTYDISGSATSLTVSHGSSVTADSAGVLLVSL